MVRLAMTVGCPSGIGPEVAVVAASSLSFRSLLVGDVEAIRAAARVRGIEAARFVRVDRVTDAWRTPRGSVAVWQPTPKLSARDRRPGVPTSAGGSAQLAWINEGCDLVARGDADALVTGPVSKEVIQRSREEGARSFLGHTEHLQRRLRAREVVMCFASDKLTTSLATTHVSLADVPRALTPSRVAASCYWTARFVAELGRSDLPVAVAALNPHAGEGGLLGREEQRVVIPGMRRAQTRLRRDRVSARFEGPVPAESAFRHALAGRYAAVVAMYHDQATIPMKLVAFGDAVNVSLGLPIIRTSVDHGTAYDVAGRGVADAQGMVHAAKLAARLARRR